jgi:hypothetical protein
LLVGPNRAERFHPRITLHRKGMASCTRRPLAGRAHEESRRTKIVVIRVVGPLSSLARCLAGSRGLARSRRARRIALRRITLHRKGMASCTRRPLAGRAHEESRRTKIPRWVVGPLSSLARCLAGSRGLARSRRARRIALRCWLAVNDMHAGARARRTSTRTLVPVLGAQPRILR